MLSRSYASNALFFSGSGLSRVGCSAARVLSVGEGGRAGRNPLPTESEASERFFIATREDLGSLAYLYTDNTSDAQDCSKRH